MIATKKLLEQAINRTKLEVLSPIIVWTGSSRRRKYLFMDLSEQELRQEATNRLKKLENLYEKYFTFSEESSRVSTINKRRETRQWVTH